MPRDLIPDIGQVRRLSDTPSRPASARTGSVGLNPKIVNVASETAFRTRGHTRPQNH